jgi:hypothetical protein
LRLALSQQGYLIPRTTENLEAYDDLLQGTDDSFGVTKEGNAKARALFEKAIELDPNYAEAYALLGLNYWAGWILAFNPDRNGIDQALKMEQREPLPSMTRCPSRTAQWLKSQNRLDNMMKRKQRPNAPYSSIPTLPQLI